MTEKFPSLLPMLLRRLSSLQVLPPIYAINSSDDVICNNVTNAN